MWRYGQARPSFIYHLVYTGTFEARVMERVLQKEELFERVRHGGGGGEAYGTCVFLFMGMHWAVVLDITTCSRPSPSAESSELCGTAGSVVLNRRQTNSQHTHVLFNQHLESTHPVTMVE